MVSGNLFVLATSAQIITLLFSLGHAGAASTTDLPIQLRRNPCLEQCAEFSTKESRDSKMADLHQ
jgi:hypothetical protein